MATIRSRLLAFHCLSFFTVLLGASLASGAPASATPWLLLDVGSGRVLAHNEEFQRWYPASLTKLMTIYVTFKALEAGEIQLNSPVHVSKNSAAEPPSKIGYKPGAVLTFDNALKILIVKSANDMATALAENVGGSEQAFVGRMNKQAALLGMWGTHYVNPHGLFASQQYTTARDQALLVRAIRTEFPQYAGYFKIEALDTGGKIIPSYDLLVGRFDGADGMKTGFVCAAGYNFIGSATRNGRTLAAIVLGTDSQIQRAERAAELLSLGFNMQPHDAPLLSSLRPKAGMNLDATTDMRDQICTQEAWARRAKEEKRDKQGHLIIDTAHLHPLVGAPHAVKVGLGGADGPESTTPRYADIPIPTPRPDYRPEQAAATSEGG